MAGSTLLEKDLNTVEQRTAKMPSYEEKKEARNASASYDFPRAAEGTRAWPAMPARRESASDPVRVNCFEASTLPARNKDLFKGYVYQDGTLMRKAPDSEMLIPVFETVKNIVEEPYFEIPDYEEPVAEPSYAETSYEETMLSAPVVEAIDIAEEDEDALPTRRTMETVTRPAASLEEMETTEAKVGFRASIAALSTKMKVALVAVVSAIVLAIVLICVNSSIIRSLDSDLATLKNRAAEERATYQTLKEESDLYTDPDSDIVREWAESNGMTK